MTPVAKKVKGKNAKQAWDQVCIQVEEKVVHPTWNQVKNHVWVQVRNQVRDKMKRKMQ
jgi:hypothetical protein